MTESNQSIGIIDLGGSTADIFIIDGEIETRHTLPGFNVLDGPNSETGKISAELEHTYIYGAGLVDSEQHSKVTEWLTSIGIISEHVEISSDLLGACRALCPSGDGFVGILGTGAIACRYQDGKIQQTLPSLGYIIGDSGSGVSIGKQIIRAYYDDKMSDQVKSSFEQHYKLTRKDFVTNLYANTQPRAYLASFSRFLEHFKNDWKNAILHQQFDDYFQRCQSHFGQDFREISFVGSIAYHFRDQLRHSAAKHKVDIKTIVKSPMDGLKDYHILAK